MDLEAAGQERGRLRSGRDDKRARRSSQQARVRSVLRSLLLDSDESDEEKGDLEQRLNPRPFALPSPDRPLVEVSANTALLRVSTAVPTELGAPATSIRHVRPHGLRVSNASFVAATPSDRSPLTDLEGVPATPTEELDVLAFGAAQAAGPDTALAFNQLKTYQDYQPHHQPGADPHQQLPREPDALQPAWEGHLPGLLTGGALLEPRAPLSYTGRQEVALIPPTLGSRPFPPPPPPFARQENPQPPLPAVAALPDSRAAVPGLARSAAAGDSAPAPTMVTALPVPGRHEPRPWSPSSRQRLVLQQTTATFPPNQYSGAPPGPQQPAVAPAAAATAAAAPPAPANKGPAFTSLTLTRSPMAVGRPQGAADAAAHSPAGAAGAAPGGSRLAVGSGTSRSSPNSHYPGLALQPCRPFSRGPAAAPAQAGGVGAGDGTAARAAAASAGRETLAAPESRSGDGDSDGLGRPSRARLNLSGRLHAYSGAGEHGQAGTLFTRVTAVALPPFQLMPAARTIGAATAGGAAAATPLPPAARQSAIEDHTPAGQALRPTAAPPSSARSTPFDDDMLAALDSLERRVCNNAGIAAAMAAGGGSDGPPPQYPMAYGAPAAGTGPAAAPTGAEGRAAQAAARIAEEVRAAGDMGHVVDRDPGAGAAGGAAGHIGPVCAPVVTALELMQREEQQRHQMQQPQREPGPQRTWAQQPRPVQQEPPLPQQLAAPPEQSVHLPAAASGSGTGPQWGAAGGQLMGREVAAGVTPQAGLRGVTHPAATLADPPGGAAAAAGAGAMVGVTPELESGGVLAALDEMEARHLQAEAAAAALGLGGGAAAAAAAPGEVAEVGAGPAAAAGGKIGGGDGGGGGGFHSRESPLPVKQLTFTPVHVAHAGQQPPPHYWQQPQHAWPQPPQPRQLGDLPPPGPRPGPQQQPQPHHAAAAPGLPPRAPANPPTAGPQRPLQDPGQQHPRPRWEGGEPGATAGGEQLLGNGEEEGQRQAHGPQHAQGQPARGPQGQEQGQQAHVQQQEAHGQQWQQGQPQWQQQQAQRQRDAALLTEQPPPQRPGQQQPPYLHEGQGNPAAQGVGAGLGALRVPAQGHARQGHEPGRQLGAVVADLTNAAVTAGPLGVMGGAASDAVNGAYALANQVLIAGLPAGSTVAEAGRAAAGAVDGAGPAGGGGCSSNSDDEEEEHAEAYAAPLTQRTVAEGHARQARRRSSLAALAGDLDASGGSQRASGNLLPSLAAVASGAAEANGGGVDGGGGDGDNVDEVAATRGIRGTAEEQVDEAPPAPPRQLEAYLPAPLCQAYYDRGGRFELYEWQAECLCQLGVLMGRNLVYCAPTSGGKSMVAEVLGIRRLLTTGKPFMLVLPFVALCAEKADALAALLAPINRVVNSAYGGQQNGKIIQPGVGAIVATIEKANMLVNAMLEEDTLGELSAVIVDELHMVGEEERGYLLELLLTKLRFATSAAAGGGGEAEEAPFDWSAVGPAYQRDGLQVIGMSATMPNVDAVATWLDAALYTTTFRPVQLQEYVKVGRRILDSSGSLVRELSVERSWEERDGDHVALLTAETVREGHSVLIFCASKILCEKVAEHIARMLQIVQRDPPPVSAAGGSGAGSASGAGAGAGAGGGDGTSPPRNARDAYVAELRRLSGADPTLPDLVARGVAYHHAGLSNEERDLVEAAYKAGAISVLTATSTLAAGVNLPARRVIFRHTYIGKQDNPIDATKYRQMSGRAGRAGIDSAGESYLLCERNKPVAPLLALMQQKASPIQSCLTETRKGMKRAVLEVVASGAVSSGGDVKRFIGCTLLHAQYGFQAVAKATIAALHWLKDNGFIRVDEGTLNWSPTPFGKATLASSMPPEDALVVRADLERARMSLVLATDLHVTYLVTPIKEDLRVDWEIYFHWFEKLSRVDARVAELVGVVPAYLVKLRQGHRGARGGAAVGADAEKERIARRFFAAMVLNDLIQEVPLKEVAEKYGLGKEKGPLEGLQERAGRFAAMVSAFCERLGWADLELIIAKFQSRVWYGVRPEVVALTEIPYVKGARARLLFKAGLRTPEAVAGCELDRLIEILSAGAPRNPEHEEQQRRTERRAARMILQGAKDLVNQKVQELKEQAKALRAALDPNATQQQSAPLDASLAPPQPPQQPRQQQPQQSEQQQQPPQASTGSAPPPAEPPDQGLPAAGQQAGSGAAAAATTVAVATAAVPDARGGPGPDGGNRAGPDRGGAGSGASTPVRPPKLQRREEDHRRALPPAVPEPSRQPPGGEGGDRGGGSPGGRMRVGPSGPAAAAAEAASGELHQPQQQGAEATAAAGCGGAAGGGELQAEQAQEGGRREQQQQLQPWQQQQQQQRHQQQQSAHIERCQHQGPGPPGAVAGSSTALPAGPAAAAPAAAPAAKRPGPAIEPDQEQALKRARPTPGAGEPPGQSVSAAQAQSVAAPPPQRPGAATAAQAKPQLSFPNPNPNQHLGPHQGQQPQQQSRQQHHVQAQQQQQQQNWQAQQHQHPRPFNPYVVNQSDNQQPLQQQRQQQQQQQQQNSAPWQHGAPSTTLPQEPPQQRVQHNPQLQQFQQHHHHHQQQQPYHHQQPQHQQQQSTGFETTAMPPTGRPPDHQPPPAQQQQQQQPQGYQPLQPHGQPPPAPPQQQQQPRPGEPPGAQQHAGDPQQRAPYGGQLRPPPSPQRALPPQVLWQHQQPWQQQQQQQQQAGPHGQSEQRNAYGAAIQTAGGGQAHGDGGPGGQHWQPRQHQHQHRPQQHEQQQQQPLPHHQQQQQQPQQHEQQQKQPPPHHQQQQQQQHQPHTGQQQPQGGVPQHGWPLVQPLNQNKGESRPQPQQRPPAPPSPHAGLRYHQQPHQRAQQNQPAWNGGAAGGATAAAPPTAPPSSPGRFPLLHAPGFTVLKTAAEVSAVCEQLRQVGVWGFALDFADAAAPPVSCAPGMQLPSVPQVALGRGVLVNSIGLPLHYDMDPGPLPAAAEAGGGGGSATTDGCGCRLEGIALCAFDGCALYVPLVASPAEAGGGWGEAAAVLQEVRQLLAHGGSTKVTFELKQQLLLARAALGAVPPGGAAAAAAAPGGASTAALTAMSGAAGTAGAGAPSAAAALPLDVCDPVVDARILLWMLNPDDPVNLPRGKSGKLTATKGLEERMKQPEVCGAGAHAKAMGALNCAGAVVRQLPCRQADACRRAAMVRRIYQDKLPRLQSEGLLRPLLDVEMPLVRVLAAMEAAGVALAPQVLRDQRGPLEARLRQLAHKAHVAAGMTFDLNSPKDVSEVLFQHLGLPPPPCAFTSQHQKHPSTKKEVLEELEESTRHPILRPLLDYRSLHKLLTGFVETLYSTARGQWLRQQQHQQQQAGGGGERPAVPDVTRLCGTWLHTGTATGRLAMDEPNLQTIPRPVEYTFQMSQESGEPMPELEPPEGGGEGGGGGRTVTMHFNLRNAFVAPPGHVILTADYKQIELRLMAHFSGDPALCELLRSPHQDPFTLLAAEWKRVPVEQVTPEVRVQAKRLAYGMLYGMGTSTLAAELGVSVHEAAELSDNFRRAIPGVDRWTKEVVEECRSCGYIVTLLGRRRYFPRINERSSKEARSQRAQSERQAVNSVCQGSAADLVKAAMITLTRRLAADGMEGRARLVLMVHDELVLEVESPLLPAVAGLVRQVLEGEVRLQVPTPVKLSAGPSWGQLQEYEPPPSLQRLMPPPPPILQQ